MRDNFEAWWESWHGSLTFNEVARAAWEAAEKSLEMEQPCGANKEFSPQTVGGCGQTSPLIQLYRCTHCDVLFHKGCIDRHWKQIVEQSDVDGTRPEHKRLYTQDEVAAEIEADARVAAALKRGIELGEERGRNFSYTAMDIYSKPGTKVRFMNLNGGENHREWARTKLIPYHIYTLKFCVVDSSRTDIYLEETEDFAFNSVMFEVVPEDAAKALQSQIASAERRGRRTAINDCKQYLRTHGVPETYGWLETELAALEAPSQAELGRDDLSGCCQSGE